MPLTLTLDYALRQLDKPGYNKEMPARRIANFGQPVAEGDWQALWSEPATQTLMLRPLQLNQDWLNSEQQLGSIIRLNDLNVEATDLSGKRVFEDAAFGNTSNPYIYHHAVAPSSWWSPAPMMPGPPGAPPTPGAAPSLTGIPSSIVNTGQDLVTVRPNNVYTPHLIVPDPVTPPTPTQIGSTSSGRFIAESKTKLDANQPMYLRWYQVQSEVGFPITYSFYLGQFCINVKDVLVEVYQDISKGGDRTLWKKVFIKPLFSVRDYSLLTGLKTSFLALTNPTEVLAHDRALLWVPFRRNQILLLASTGAFGLIQVNANPKRLADDSDWDITRSDTVVVWCLTPAPGRFQLQRVKYQTGDVKVEAPSFVMDYTPAATPTVTLQKDSDHTTTITSAIVAPPANTITTPNAEDCQPKATAPSSQSKTYGITLTFNASSDGRWTPFFYRLDVSSPRTYLTPSTTPVTVNDVSTGDSYVQSASFHAGQKPGDGRCTVKVIDKGSYPLSPFYYRHALPFQLTSIGTSAFVGITEPTEVVPIKLTARPRALTFSAMDLWKLLTHTFFAEDRDYTNTGHISAVLDVLALAGYDTATYTTDTPPLTTANNTLLGLGSAPAVSQTDRTHKPGWQPDRNESAAHFIQRIAEKFSGWMIGFHPNGTFFYHPKDYYTSISATFSAVHTGSAPFFYDATFRTIEPEANVLAVIGGDEKTGNLRLSARMIDYASIKNPAVVNYLGRARTEVVQLTGTYSCAQLNWIARKMWNASRRRHLTAEFRADFVPTLQVGQVVTLGSYGNYRIQEFEAECVKDRWRPTRYVGELVELGYGL